MEILMLSADDVRAVTTMPRAIAAMRRGMEALFRREIDAPLRTPIHQPNGVSFFMPAASRASVGIKIVSVFGNNPTNSLPVINGVYVLVDHDTGVPVAVMDATYMTALRTGATTGLATDLLAPPEASVLTIFGAGGQAQSLIDGVRAVRPIEEIRVVSKGGASAQRLAAQQAIPSMAFAGTRKALDGADVVITATPSTEPLFATTLLNSPVHISAIGSYSLEMRELPADCFADADVVVEHRASAIAESGEINDALDQKVIGPDALIELGALIAGGASLAGHPRTIFKSMGHAAQDITIADEIYTTAKAEGIGTVVTL